MPLPAVNSHIIKSMTKQNIPYIHTHTAFSAYPTKLGRANKLVIIVLNYTQRKSAALSSNS